MTCVCSQANKHFQTDHNYLLNGTHNHTLRKTKKQMRIHTVSLFEHTYSNVKLRKREFGVSVVGRFGSQREEEKMHK